MPPQRILSFCIKTHFYAETYTNHACPIVSFCLKPIKELTVFLFYFYFAITFRQQKMQTLTNLKLQQRSSCFQIHGRLNLDWLLQLSRLGGNSSRLSSKMNYKNYTSEVCDADAFLYCELNNLYIRKSLYLLIFNSMISFREHFL